MYTSYDVARQLVQIGNYVKLPVEGLAEVPTDVLSALLQLTAEWRNVNEMETLIKMGANPHETHEGFTVLEMFVQGHDGYWCGKDSVKNVEEGVKMLATYGVTCEDLSHRWILSNCKAIITNSEYLTEFFNVMDYPTFPDEEADVATDESGPTHVEIEEEEEEPEVNSHPSSARREYVRWILNTSK